MSYLALGLVAGAAAIERKGFLQAMLSRPIALGAITGAVLGDVGTGLAVGIPLELLWLGAINMGASLPVHEALGTAAAAGAAVLAMRSVRGAPDSEPALAAAVAVLSIALCSPLASLGRRVDRAVERWNDHLYARAERDLAAGELGAAARVNLLGLGWPFAMGFTLAPVGAGCAAAVIEVALAEFPAAVPPLGVAWVAFGGFACASGARTMRSRRAPVAFHLALAVAAVLVAVWMLTRGAP